MEKTSGARETQYRTAPSAPQRHTSASVAGLASATGGRAVFGRRVSLFPSGQDGWAKPARSQFGRRGYNTVSVFTYSCDSAGDVKEINVLQTRERMSRGGYPIDPQFAPLTPTTHNPPISIGFPCSPAVVVARVEGRSVAVAPRRLSGCRLCLEGSGAGGRRGMVTAGVVAQRYRYVTGTGASSR